MARPRPSAVLDFIRQLAADAGNLSDRDLLERFVAGHDDNAFKALVRRHGTMVLRVCQAVLFRPEDAEDVFQATFMVLARKAPILKWEDSISTWLHQTAYHLARTARRNKQRRET